MQWEAGLLPWEACSLMEGAERGRLGGRQCDGGCRKGCSGRQACCRGRHAVSGVRAFGVGKPGMI